VPFPGKPSKATPKNTHKSILDYDPKRKCKRRLANDEGTCDRIWGHNGPHSDTYMRKHGSA
jgi:hypothetical protein